MTVGNTEVLYIKISGEGLPREHSTLEVLGLIAAAPYERDCLIKDLRK